MTRTQQRVSPHGGAASCRVLITLFITQLLVFADDEICTLCPGDGATNDTILLDSKDLTNIVSWPTSVSNCSELEAYTTSLQADSEECTRVQSIGTICGCPIPENSCQLCENGFNATLPEKELQFLKRDFDGVAPTCELFNAFLHSFPTNTTKCVEAHMADAACGCPLAKSSCRYCAENKTVATPQTRLSGVELGAKDWDFDEPTCELLESAVYLLLSSNTSACSRIQAEGYACGCGSDEYNRRQAILSWLPRISAVMSFFGSLYIIRDVWRKPKSEQTTQHHLLVAMSSFDCVSSIWWSLTTLPMPEDTNVFGAKGNEATCTAQGFFIQLGFTSPFLNLSLALYYWCVIAYGWKEGRIKRYKLVLFGAPVSVGLGLALAAIPRYDADVIMCYLPSQTSDVWDINRMVFLVIPMSLVIFFATIITFLIYLKVYHQQQASARWSMTSNASTLRRKVFWQGFWYLMCFYLSWPILVVVVTVDSNLYQRYGFLCLAMFMAPIQGFTNFVAYARPRFLRYLNSKGWRCCKSTLAAQETTASSMPSTCTTKEQVEQETESVVQVVDSTTKEESMNSMTRAATIDLGTSSSVPSSHTAKGKMELQGVVQGVEPTTGKVESMDPIAEGDGGSTDGATSAIPSSYTTNEQEEATSIVHGAEPTTTRVASVDSMEDAASVEGGNNERFEDDPF